jgi:hypothetical protein
MVSVMLVNDRCKIPRKVLTRFNFSTEEILHKVYGEGITGHPEDGVFFAFLL